MFLPILCLKTGQRLLRQLLLVLPVILGGPAAKCQLGMLVTPNRVVFNKATNYAEVNLSNTGTDTVTYLVNPKQYRMHNDGGFQEILVPDPGQYFASDHILFYPRRITLAPGQSQVIELRIPDSEELEQKEYRSHMCIRTEVKKTTKHVVTPDAHGITVSLIPSFGVTIPLIIRRGDLGADVSISDIAFNEITKPRVEFTLTRTGEMSVYGHIVVEHVSPEMEVTRVAVVKGVAVYTPNANRHVAVDLDRNKKLDYSRGSLRVTYDAESEGVITVSEASLMLENTVVNEHVSPANSYEEGQLNAKM